MTAPAPADLEDRVGHRFRDAGLLARALTHPSYAHEHPPEPHNEAMAFLGDAVVGLVVAELLAARFPEDGAGPLTQRRAALVSEPSLAVWAERLEIPTVLRLGRGEDQGRGRSKPSILATAFEAVLGAIYLDGGLAPARQLVERLVNESPSQPSGSDVLT